MRQAKFPIRPPEPVPLEKHIALEVIQALRLVGCHVSSTQQTRASRQTVGMPDLYVTHAAWGVAAWIEVKRPGEEPRPSQLEWHERTRAADVHVLVVTSAAEAVEQFARLPRRRPAAEALGLTSTAKE